jgi:hypothetical protein
MPHAERSRANVHLETLKGVIVELLGSYTVVPILAVPHSPPTALASLLGARFKVDEDRRTGRVEHDGGVVDVALMEEVGQLLTATHVNEPEGVKMVDGPSEFHQHLLAIDLAPCILDSLLVALKGDISDAFSIADDTMVLHDMRMRVMAKLALPKVDFGERVSGETSGIFDRERRGFVCDSFDVLAVEKRFGERRDVGGKERKEGFDAHRVLRDELVELEGAFRLRDEVDLVVLFPGDVGGDVGGAAGHSLDSCP